MGEFCCSLEMKGVVRVVGSSTEGLGECKKGRARGLWQWRSLTTQAKMEGFFDKKGRRTELWRGWDEEGRRRWEGQYEKGPRVGLWVSYHTGGALREVLAYKDGKLGYAGLLMREDATPARLASFGDGVLEGDAFFFDEETTLTCTCQYTSGVLQGCFTWPELH